MKLEAARLYTTVYSTVNYLLLWTAPGGGKAVSFGCSLTPRREAPRGRPHSGSSGSSDKSPGTLLRYRAAALQHWCTAAHLSTCSLEELTTGPTCTVLSLLQLLRSFVRSGMYLRYPGTGYRTSSPPRQLFTTIRYMCRLLRTIFTENRFGLSHVPVLSGGS